MATFRTPSTAQVTNDLTARLAWSADAFGDRTFLVDAAHPSTALSYGELAARADAAASMFASLGVGPGDGIHLVLRNSWQLVACLFGAARLGAFVVPTNPRSTLDDVAYIVSHAECRVSVASGEAAELVASARELAPELQHLLATDGVLSGALDLDAALDEHAATTPPPQQHRDLVAVMYTSGATGWPKGVMLTHGNLLFAGDAVSGMLRIRPDDRWLVTLPMSHLNALGYSTMSAFCSGASVAISERFDAGTWADTATATCSTLASLFSVHVRRLLEQTDDGEHPNPLRLLMFAMHLSSGEREQVTHRFGLDPMQVYGLTETVAPNVAEPLIGPRDPASIGVPTSWSHLTIVDDDDHEVADGEAGELAITGEPGRSLTPGYYRRDDETAQVFRNGRFHTGDQMRRGEGGELYFLGRNTDVLKPGVENVSAVEIERVMIEHVSVLDAAVIGRRDDDGNELIVAYVVLRPTDDVTEAELRAWAASRLAPHKVPNQLVTIDELPRTPVGKIRKPALLEALGHDATT